MTKRTVTVFGGSGFLGRRIVRHVRDNGCCVRIASRHPDRAQALFASDDRDLEAISADVHDDTAVASAVVGAHAVVNAVSLYVERAGQTFQSTHVEAAARVATHARRAGLERLVHLSGIGADAESRSPYIRSRGQGELAVQAEFPDATIVRPAVMFGPDDAFLSTLVDLLKRLPAYPLLGRGRTRLQPAHVDDVAEAVARALESERRRITYELGGPAVVTYEALVGAITHRIGRKRLIVPVPFPLWHALAWLAEMLPTPPLTRNQVELMEIDTVASVDLPGFADLALSPQPMEPVLRDMTRQT